MKKTILLSTMVLASTAAFAQREVGKFTAHPKMGINLANLIDPDGTDNIRMGLVIGGELEYQVAKIFSVSLGALYSQQGAKTTADIDTDYGIWSGDVTLRLDYINIPVLANVYLAKGFAIKAGIQPCFKINSAVKVKVDGTSITTSVSGVKRVDFAIPVGLSYEYGNLVLDTRYNMGITKIVDTDKLYNIVVQMTMGYKFDL